MIEKEGNVKLFTQLGNVVKILELESPIEFMDNLAKVSQIALLKKDIRFHKTEFKKN